MRNGYQRVREMIRSNPLQLAYLKDKHLIAYANSLWPYSIGMEFECRLSSEVTANSWHHNPEEQKWQLDRNLLICHKGFKTVATTKHDDEHRFRVTSGIYGFIALYKLSAFLKEHYVENTGSGVHYHVDCTDIPHFANTYKDENIYYFHFNSQGFMSQVQPWVLKALKSWNYKGTFNKWELSSNKEAVRFHGKYSTIEYRIGEMTFDYELLLKRIMHAQHITQRIKKEYPVYFKQQITNLHEKINKGSYLWADDAALMKIINR